MSNKAIVDVPFGVGHVRFENLSVEQANVLVHLCDNQVRKPRVGTTLHTFKVLTTEEVMEGRSNAYEFIDFDKQETLEEDKKSLLDIRAEILNSYSSGIKTIEEIDLLLNQYVEIINKERSYSEEEVMDMFHKFSMHLPLHYEFLVKEQFKKE